VVDFGLDSVEYMLRSFLTARGSVLVIKLLPSIKICYAFGVLSKKLHIEQWGWTLMCLDAKDSYPRHYSMQRSP
jgi:hypothetical protein